ncbi:MAG: hypothetical protein R2847_10775 [Bacteroidia bacterium]
MADIEGKMDADMSKGEWKNFTFSGRMDGFKGMQGDTRKTFTVYGSVTANNQKVEVKNIPSAFGDIGITYDVPNLKIYWRFATEQTNWCIVYFRHCQYGGGWKRMVFFWQKANSGHWHFKCRNDDR